MRLPENIPESIERVRLLHTSNENIKWKTESLLKSNQDIKLINMKLHEEIYQLKRRDKSEISQLESIIVNLRANMNILHTYYNTLSIQTKNQIQYWKSIHSNLGNIVQKIKAQTRISTINLKENIQELGFKHHNEYTRMREKYNRIIKLNKNLKINNVIAVANLWRLKSLINNRAEELVKLTSKNEISSKTQIFHSFQAIHNENKYKKNKDIEFLRGQLGGLDDLSAALGQDMGTFNEESDARTLKIKARIFSSTNEILRWVQIKENPSRYEKHKIGDITSEYIIIRNNMQNQINLLQDDNLVLRNENVKIEGENYILEQKLRENEQQWRTDLLNLKEELIKTHDMFEMLKNIHIEYKNQPDDYIREEIIHLRLEKNALREYILQKDQEKDEIINNLKSIILGQRTNIHSSRGSSELETMLFMKAKLQDYDNKLKAERVGKDNHVNTIINPSFLKKNIDQLNKENNILGKAIIEKNIEINMIRRDKQILKLNIESMISNFNHLRNIPEKSLVKSNLINLKNELSNCDEQFQKIKTDHISFKNAPDELFREEILDLRRENINQLNEERTRTKQDKLNIKTKLEDLLNNFHQLGNIHIEYKNTPDEIYRQEIEALNDENSLLKNKNDLLKAEIDRLNGDKTNLKSSLILSLHSRHTNSDMGTNTDDLSNRFIKMKYEDLVHEQKLFVENMNNKVSDLSAENIRLKHNIIMGNERLKARKTVHKEKESYTINDEIFRKQIEDLLDESTKNNQRLHAQLERLKEDKISLKSLLSSLKKGNLTQKSGVTDPEDEIFRQEIEVLYDQNSALRVKKDQLNKEVEMLKAEIDRLNGDKTNLKSSLILSLHSRHTNSDMGTNTDDLSNRFIKMKYEDLVHEQKLFVENMNNKVSDLSAENIRLKHNIIMGNERLKARKTVHKEKESYTINDEIFRKQIEDLLDESTKNNQRLHAQLERLKEDKISLKSLLSSLKKGNLTQKSGVTDPEDEIFRQEIEVLYDQNSALRVKKDQLNKEVEMLKAEIDLLNGDKTNLKSSLILSLHSRHTNSDMGTNTDDLSNRFIKMKYEDLVHEQKLFVENMNNKVSDLSAENIRLKHNIIMGNERLKARKTVHKEKESYTINDEIFRKQIEDLLDESTKNNQRLHAQLERLKEDKISLKSLLSSLKKGNLTQKSGVTDPEDEIFRQEIEVLYDQNSALRVKKDQLNKEVEMLKAEIDRLNGDKTNLKSSLILSLHSRHTNSDMGTNTDDLSNRFIKMKYEDLVHEQKLFVENMNNKVSDLSAENIRLKHNIIMGNERLKARKTVHKEKESYTINDEIFRKQIEDLLDESTKNNQRLHAQLERLKEDKISLKSLLSSLKKGNLTQKSGVTDPEDEIFRQEIEVLYDQNSALRVKKDQLNKEVEMLKAEIDRLNGDKTNLKSSLILSLHSRHTNSDMGTNTDDLSNRFIKMKYEDLVHEQKLFVENMNNKVSDLSAENIRLKHSIIMGNERLKARKTISQEKQLEPNDVVILRKQIEYLLDESTNNNQRLQVHIDHIKGVYRHQIDDIIYQNIHKIKYLEDHIREIKANKMKIKQLLAEESAGKIKYKQEEHYSNMLFLKRQFEGLKFEQNIFNRNTFLQLYELYRANNNLKQVLFLHNENLKGRKIYTHITQKFTSNDEVFRLQIQNLIDQNKIKNKKLEEEIAELKKDKINLKELITKNQVNLNRESKNKDYYMNTVILLKDHLKTISIEQNLFIKNKNLLLDKLTDQISQLNTDKNNIKLYLTTNQGNMKTYRKIINNNIYTNTQIMKKELEGLGIAQNRFANNMNTKLVELRRSNNNLKEQLILDRESIRTFKENQAEIANSPEHSLRREIIDLNYLNNQISIRNEHLSAELDMVIKDKLNMKVHLTYPNNLHTFNTLNQNSEINAKKLLKEKIANLRVECDQLVQNRDKRIELISEEKLRAKSQTSDLLSHYKHDKQRLRTKLITFIENTNRFKYELTSRQFNIYKTKNILESINPMKDNLVNNKKFLTNLLYKHSILLSKANTLNNKEELYINYLENSLVQENIEKDSLTTSMNILEAEYKELRKQKSRGQGLWGSKEYIYKHKLPNRQEVKLLYVDSPYPIQMLVVEEGTVWNKYIRQMDRVDDEGIIIPGNITNSLIPQITPQIKYKRGEIVDAKYYIAPSTTGTNILVIDLEDFNYKEIELIADELDTTESEIMGCTSLHNGLGVCCKANGFIYSYDFDYFHDDTQVPVLYYHFTGGTGDINICKGITDGRLAIGDGSSIFVYNKEDGTSVNSGQTEGNQGQMIQLGDNSVLVTQEHNCLVLNYLTGESVNFNYHYGSPKAYNYQAATRITSDADERLAMAWYSQTYGGLGIDILAYNNPGISILYTVYVNGKCVKPFVYLLEELDKSSSLIVGIQGENSCNMLCIVTYIEITIVCKDPSPTNQITDLIFSPFAY